MNKTPIQWCDFSVNPFRFRNLETGKVGHHCAKISPGCKFCYSSTMQAGPYLSGLTFIEENKPKGEFFLDDAALQQVLKRRKPCRIFWCDMTDMFLEDYPEEWIDRCFAVMALTPHITHQVLTKRAGRMREWASRTVPDVRIQTAIGKLRGTGWGNQKPEFPLPNVWLGVSCEDQQRADERIPELLRTPAAVRFLSVEPMLGPVDIASMPWRSFDPLHITQTIDWVIIGGESGPGSRPCDLAWIRALVKQCGYAGVACFVKQLGAKPFDAPRYRQELPWPMETEWRNATEPNLRDKKGGDISEFPEDLRVRQFPEVRP